MWIGRCQRHSQPSNDPDVGLRPCDPRHDRQRGSARCQMQECAAGKFHGGSLNCLREGFRDALSLPVRTNGSPGTSNFSTQYTAPRGGGRTKKADDQRDSRISSSVIHGRSDSGGPTMLTTMTEADWTIVLQIFGASRSRRGDKGRDDRKFLEALHYFVVHNITWRALPAQFGHWNSVWKRFWRLSRYIRSLLRCARGGERDRASGSNV